MNITMVMCQRDNATPSKLLSGWPCASSRNRLPSPANQATVEGAKRRQRNDHRDDPLGARKHVRRPWLVRKGQYRSDQGE